ncbi:hypothetical protein [Klebsiella pasteurii]|uniref:hypothetical protein n=1 Tax=Klebsiella pasteurii TaxID=2587529 RepID=UPI00391BC69A
MKISPSSVSLNNLFILSTSRSSCFSNQSASTIGENEIIRGGEETVIFKAIVLTKGVPSSACQSLSSASLTIRRSI